MKKKIKNSTNTNVVKDFDVLFNFGVLKHLLKYISCSFMVHLHVIELWVEDKCCSFRIFYVVGPHAYICKAISF
jgi:hypothetical protein